MAFGSRFDEARYTSAQPSLDEFRELPKSGFRRVIDLRPRSEDHGFDETEAAASAGLEYLSLPIADEKDLTPANVRTLGLWLADPAQPMTPIHCGSSNRVGALLALRAGWLRGASTDAAIEIGRGAGLKSLESAVRHALDRGR